ncbi:MAG: hypothetical protein Q9167_000254 [Letrouitia subvulpina]
MTINSIRYTDSEQSSNRRVGRLSPKPPPKLWSPIDPPFRGVQALPSEGYKHSSAETAIVIDNGASLIRAGWSFDKAPRLSFTPTVARYRDRKFNRTVSYVGYDAYADATTRGQIRNAFEPGSSIVSNWDVMENILDSTFVRLGINGEDGGIGRPIVMTEPVANLGYTRKRNSGLIVSSSHTSTHLIPVIKSKPVTSSITRLNWGGEQGTEYLLKLLKLKYPNFPGKITDYQVEEMIRQHCYISRNYDKDLRSFLDWSGLEERDRVIQYPFNEQVVVEKSEEELAKIAERKRESGRRLQEQAAKMRLEKLIRKEQTLDYYKNLQQKLSNQTKKEVKRLLDEDEFKDETQLDKTIKELEKSVRKARNKDVGITENPAEEEATFPLLEIPDENLDEAGLKEKRHQRLMKSSVEARARAKAEKEQEKARLVEEERRDNERRENDLEGWLEERRTFISKIKDRERFKADLGNRKSLASQMRMKTLASLASDQPGRKRRRGGDDDDFGANDDDWGVYRTVAIGEQSDDEEEEDLAAGLKAVEAQLLKHDPGFDESNTLEAQSDWSKSLVHAFLRGPRPFDSQSQQELHQLHLNVERIRVPEVIFQPSIAGLDQAGIVDIVADIFNHGLTKVPNQIDMLRDIFLTGGNTLFRGFEERFRKELRAVLPLEALIEVRRARDPLLDAWKGAAQWSKEPAFIQCALTREDYHERGLDYLKEHNLGNSFGL